MHGLNKPSGSNSLAEFDRIVRFVAREGCSILLVEKLKTSAPGSHFRPSALDRDVESKSFGIKEHGLLTTIDGAFVRNLRSGRPALCRVCVTVFIIVLSSASSLLPDKKSST